MESILKNKDLSNKSVSSIILLEYKISKFKKGYKPTRSHFYSNIDIKRFYLDDQYSNEIVKIYKDIKYIDKNLAILEGILAKKYFSLYYTDEENNRRTNRKLSKVPRTNGPPQC